MEPAEIHRQLRALSQQDLVPQSHQQYLRQLCSRGLRPQVIYDLGACVGHWIRAARTAWPDSQYYAIEAQQECQFIYPELGVASEIALIGESTGQLVPFYQNTVHPGGNSRYLENAEINPQSRNYFDPERFLLKSTERLDDLIRRRGWPWPDLIKMDIQGSELAALQGSAQALAHARDLILELQHCEYNQGAPGYEVVCDWLDSRGWRLVSCFSRTSVDADYHFQRLS